MLVPGVGTFFFEPLQNVAQRLVILETLSAALAIKNDDRDAPEALPRNSPVRPLLDHFVHAIFTPGGDPLDLMNFLERFLAQGFLPTVRRLVHFDEPLLGGAENHRIVAAPAMRVSVLVVVMAEERAALLEQLHDDRIRAEDVLALVFGQAFGIHAFVVERRVNLQTIFLSGIEVLGAMTWSGVHDAAALVEGAVFGKNSGHLNVQEGMLNFQAL